MLDLAMHDRGKPVLLKQLADRQGLSVKYLEQLVGPLRRAGLVRSKRGVSGGFHLARPAEEILLLEVVEAVEGPLSLVDCVMHPSGCPRATRCVTMEVWAEASMAMRQVLSRITLADLIGRHGTKG
jgi:Rrf2 family protein